MIGKKRSGFPLISITEDVNVKSSVSNSAKNHKPFLFSGKENTPLSSTTYKDTGDNNEAFHRTNGGYCPSFDICSDPMRIYGGPSSSSQWGDSSFGSSLDELDSVILENSAYRSPCPLTSVDHCNAESVSGKFDSVESRLLSSSSSSSLFLRKGEDIGGDDNKDEEEFEANTQFGVLMKLCSEEDDFLPHDPDSVLVCPLCEIDISQWDEESRQCHANACLDNFVIPQAVMDSPIAKYPAGPILITYKRRSKENNRME